MGEMKRGGAPRGRASVRKRVQLAWRLLAGGLLLLAAGPLYSWLGLHYSGELVLAQKVSAADTIRGFDFGPVYLREGTPGRYYIKAQLPKCDEGLWHTSFEVLNEQLLPVYREDELRFIGDFQFAAGQVDSFARNFRLDKQTGYYHFRFTAYNGTYPETSADDPVVEFAVRQNVLTGAALWGPMAGLMLAGLILLGCAMQVIRRLGEAGQGRPRGRRMPQAITPEGALPSARQLPVAAANGTDGKDDFYSTLMRRRQGFNIKR